MPTLAPPSGPITNHVMISHTDYFIGTFPHVSGAYVAEDATANKPDADSMPTGAKNTAVDNVKKTHHRQSSLSSFRNHSLLPPNQGLCHTQILGAVAVLKRFNVGHSHLSLIHI